MPTLLFGILAGAVLFAGISHQRGMWTLPDNPVEDYVTDAGLPASIMVAADLFGPPKPNKVVYLNREGVLLRSGADDATLNMSSIVANSGRASAFIPPFSGSPRRWNQITACIREKFKPFDVKIVEQRPLDGDFVMAVLGGTPKDLGLTKKSDQHFHATGLAPFNGEVVPNAVVLVFTRSLRHAVRSVCETAAMEIAHAYGLDHSRHCKDLMTYMKPCGKKRFTDRDVVCGEHANRDCHGDKPTQNAYRYMMTLLGPATGG